MAGRRHRLGGRRQAVGLTQEALAERLGVDRSTIVRWEAGTASPQPWMRPRLADALQVTTEGLDGLLARGTGPAERPELRPRYSMHGFEESPLASGTVEPDWDDPVAIASAVGELLASNTAPAAIDAAEESLLRIIDEYESDGPTGPARLGVRARKLRTHLHGLLQGRQPASQRTALFRVAARTSAVLGYMAVNAGHHGLAASYCTEAVAMAQDISDLETVMWTHGTRSLSAYYAGNFANAAAWADAGIALAPDHPQSIRLYANGLARALARLGDHPGTLRAIGAAEDLSSRHGVTTGLTPCISLEPYGVTRTLANAITGHVALGDTAEVLRYEREISAYVAAADSQWTHSLVRLDVATALLSGRGPDVEQAMIIGRQVLHDAEDGPLILSVVQRAHDLLRNAQPWSDVATVREYAEALVLWSATPRVRQLACSATMPASPQALGRTSRDATTKHIAPGRVSRNPTAEP